MSTEEQRAEDGTEEQRAETTIEQDIETNLKGEETEIEDIEVTDEEVEAELEASIQEALEPHPMWDKRYKEAFAELGSMEKGRDFQKAMLELFEGEQQYKTQIEQDRAQWRKFAEPIYEAIQPYQDLITASGATPDQMIRQALSLVKRLSQDPRATIMGLAQRAGIDLNQLTQEAPYVDPQVQELQRTIQQMRAEQRQQQESQYRAQQHRMLSEVEQQLRAFTEAKDERGKPKYPHVSLVENEMSILIRGNPSLSLEDAYSQACRLSDEVTQAETRRKEAEDAARKAAKAKKEQLAAKRVLGKPGVDVPPAEDLEESIRKEFRRQTQAA